MSGQKKYVALLYKIARLTKITSRCSHSRFVPALSFMRALLVSQKSIYCRRFMKLFFYKREFRPEQHLEYVIDINKVFLEIRPSQNDQNIRFSYHFIFHQEGEQQCKNTHFFFLNKSVFRYFIDTLNTSKYFHWFNFHCIGLLRKSPYSLKFLGFFKNFLGLFIILFVIKLYVFLIILKSYGNMGKKDQSFIF